MKILDRIVTAFILLIVCATVAALVWPDVFPETRAALKDLLP